MTIETVIKRKIRKLKETIPDINEKQLERELIPLSGEKIQPKIVKKRKV